jgi:cytochrome c553
MFPSRVSPLSTFPLFIVFSFVLASGFAAPAEAKSRGEQLFKLCVQCHGANAEGNQELEAPKIAGLPAWYLKAQLTKFRDGIRGKHPADRAGMRMRPMARTIKDTADLEAVADYVAALKNPEVPETVEGNPVKGMESYAVCSTCHGVKAEGMQALNAPPLVGMSDWYLLTQLKNFKAKVRGGDPAKDVTGSQMQAMSMTLDDEGMVNVISYINKLK